MPRQDLLFPKKTSCARRENNLVRTNVESVVSLQSIQETITIIIIIIIIIKCFSTAPVFVTWFIGAVNDEGGRGLLSSQNLSLSQMDLLKKFTASSWRSIWVQISSLASWNLSLVMVKALSVFSILWGEIYLFLAVVSIRFLSYGLPGFIPF